MRRARRRCSENGLWRSSPSVRGKFMETTPRGNSFLEAIIRPRVAGSGELISSLQQELAASNPMEAVSPAPAVTMLAPPDWRSNQSSIQSQRLRYSLHRLDAERDVLFQIYGKIRGTLNYVIPIHAAGEGFVFHLLYDGLCLHLGQRFSRFHQRACRDESG